MAPANLKSLAQAGGTSDAVIIDVTGNTVTQQLHDALAKAQTKAIALLVPDPALDGRHRPSTSTRSTCSSPAATAPPPPSGTPARSVGVRQGRLVLRRRSRGRHADEDYRLPDHLHSVQRRRQRPRRHRARLRHHQRHLANAQGQIASARPKADQRLEASSLHPCPARDKGLQRACGRTPRIPRLPRQDDPGRSGRSRRPPRRRSRRPPPGGRPGHPGPRPPPRPGARDRYWFDR